MGMGAARRICCDAVNFDVVRRRRKPGERNHAAGANPYAFADQTDDRKLVSQLLIALKQLFGVLPHHQHLLNKHGRSTALSGGHHRDGGGRFLGWSSLSLAAIRGDEFKGGVPYGHAQEFAFFVRYLQEPARPAPRVAGDLGIAQVAYHRQRLFASGGAVRQFDPFVVR